MKKIVFTSAILMFFLVSCSYSTTPPTDSTTSSGTVATDSSQSDKNLVNNRKVYHAIETGDSTVINALIANDAIDHQGTNGQEIKSGDSIKYMLADMHNHVKDIKMEIITDAANGDYVFSFIHFTGTLIDNYMGMPAGSKLDEKGVDVVKIENNKMSEHWGYVDGNEMMKRMKEMPMGKMKTK